MVNKLNSVQKATDLKKKSKVEMNEMYSKYNLGNHITALHCTNYLDRFPFTDMVEGEDVQ